MKPFNAKRNAAGFTLLELLIVVIIIGIILVIVAMNTVGNTAGARAKMLQRMASASIQNANLIAQSCGTSTAVTASPIPASGKNMADVILGGPSNVSSSYLDCYQRAGVRALRDGVSRNGNAWAVADYPYSLSGGGTAKLQVSYSTVPDEVTLALAQTFTTNLTALAASDTTGDVVRYSGAVGGTRTVTYLAD